MDEESVEGTLAVDFTTDYTVSVHLTGSCDDDDVFVLVYKRVCVCVLSLSIFLTRRSQKQQKLQQGSGEGFLGDACDVICPGM